MADVVKNILLRVTTETKKAAEDMERIADNADKAKEKIGKAGEETDKLVSLAKKGAAAFATMFAIDKIIGFAKACGELYDQQAKAEAALLTALKGREDIQRRLIRLAGELQRKTLYGDEQTIKAMSFMTTIMGENEEALKRLIPLVQDLATNKQMDLMTAAEQVAVSVASSSNSLSAYGIELTGAAGSAERLEIAIRELNRQVGGQAEAAAKTGLGAFQQLSNVWGDFKEKLGEIVIESGVLKEVLNDLMDVLLKLTDSIGKKEGYEKAEEMLSRIKDGYVGVFKEVEGGGMKLEKITAFKYVSGELARLRDELDKASEKYVDLSIKMASKDPIFKIFGKKELAETEEMIDSEQKPTTPLPPKEDLGKWLDDAKDVNEDYITDLDAIFDEMARIAGEAGNMMAEKNAEAARKAKEAWDETKESVISAGDEIADNAEQNYQKEIEAIERVEQATRVRMQVLMELGNIIMDMSQLYEKDKEKLKAMQIAATLIQTYASAVVAFKNGMEIGGPILAAIQAASFPLADEYGPIAGVVHENEYVFDEAKTALLRPLFDDIQHDRIDVKALAALTRRRDFKPVVNTMSTQVVEKLLRDIYDKLPGVVDETVDAGDVVIRRRGNTKWKIRKK